MDTLNAIFSRHSISNLRPDAVPVEMIERLLAAAVQAPNHFKVRPWRFVVLTGKAREHLGDLFADLLHESQPDVPLAGLDKERAKPLRAPLLIAVGVDKPNDTRSIEIENICAVAAACENLLLAAHAMGLEGIWRTGPQALNPRVKAFLGLDPDQPLIAFLYIGYPNEVNQIGVDRPSYVDRTTWME